MAEWRDVVGFEGEYIVSSIGEVVSLNYNNTKEPRSLRLFLNNKTGYVYVFLYKNGRKYSKRVHRLVAESFIENPNEYDIVNHKDENKSNNRVRNLEWCTSKYNNNYGTRLAKVSKQVVRMSVDGEVLGTYKSIRHAARVHGIDNSTISLACRGKVKTAGGFKWEYK